MKDRQLARLNALREHLKAAKVDGALLSDADAINYFSGFWGYSGLQTAGRPTLIWVPAADDAEVITPVLELEMAQRMSAIQNIRDWMDGIDGEWRGPLRVSLKKGHVKRVALDLWRAPSVIMSFLYDEWPDIEKVDVNPILDEMRMVKDVDELKIMRDAGQVAIAMAQAAVETIGIGVPEYEVALASIVAGTRKAASLIPEDSSAFDTPMIHNLQILQSGTDTCMVHRRPTVRPLQEGDPIYLCYCELARFRGYSLGFDREYFVRSATDEQARLYEVTLKAQAAALHTIRPGIPAEEVHFAADAVYRDAGFSPTYRTGRGVGCAMVERPEFKAGDKTPLKPGMTFAVDGGLTVEGSFGARVGDSIVVTETGFEYLTPFPKELRLLG